MPDPEKTIGGDVSPVDPDVHLQRLAPQQDLSLPWYRSLYTNLKDLIRPPRLPPLEVTSQPVMVKDIWGLYGRQKKSFVLSTAFQVAVVGVVVLVGLAKPEIAHTITAQVKQIFYDPVVPASVPQKPMAHVSGGSGGDRSPLRASRGDVARTAPRKFAPPVAVYNNQNPQITFVPTILGDLSPVSYEPKQYGDPFGALGPPSNGQGCCAGIGNKLGHGGQGDGDGDSAGPGKDGNGFGQPIYNASARGLTNPVALFRPEPDYSDDARKAKLQGTVVLDVVVDQAGRPQIRKVLQSLGLGLDEKAIQAVSTWRFKAGTMNGKPVPVSVQILVSFRLL